MVLQLQIASLFIFPFLVSFLAVHHHEGLFLLVEGDEQLVRAACNKTQYPNLCISILVANSSSLTADVRGLATISTGALLVKTSDAKSYVRSLARHTHDAFLKEVLRYCTYDYRVGLRNVRHTLAFLDAKDLTDADASVVVAMQMAGGCRKAFHLLNLTYPHEISKREEGIKKLTMIAKGIIGILKTSE